MTTHTTTVAARLAALVHALENCQRSGNAEWLSRHSDSLAAVASEHLPRGSGLDSGSHLQVHESGAERLVIRADFHHMDQHGFYSGWTEHKVICTPGFNGIQIRITGRDRNGIKDYLTELFHHALSREISA